VGAKLLSAAEFSDVGGDCPRPDEPDDRHVSVFDRIDKLVALLREQACAGRRVRQHLLERGLRPARFQCIGPFDGRRIGGEVPGERLPVFSLFEGFVERANCSNGRRAH
jgi:hypothetical protein